MSLQQQNKINRILNVLKTTLSIAKNHKKKTVLLVIIISMYALWKLKHKLPYGKIMNLVMQRIIKGMATKQSHEEFLERMNVQLTLQLEEFDKSQYFQQLQIKYSKYFKIEHYRNELRTNIKNLNQEKKTELWQNIVDEIILFSQFFLIITRQTETMNIIQKTLVAKYKDDLMNIIGIDKNNVNHCHILEQILNQYAAQHIDHNLPQLYAFLQNHLKHDIKPTTQMNFFDLQKALLNIFQDNLFSHITSSNDDNYNVNNNNSSNNSNNNGSKINNKQNKSKKINSSYLTNSADRNVEKLFFAPHDPTYEKDSIITRSMSFIRGIGKSILPNMFPEEAILLPTQNRYQLLNILFNNQQQETVAEMNSNKIISTVFKSFFASNNNANNNDLDQSNDSLISNDFSNENAGQEQEEEIEQFKQNEINANKVIDIKNTTNLKDSKIITNNGIEQGKVLCSLIIKEYRDILDMQSLHNYFYYSSIFQLRKFLNRVLLALHKRNELNKVQQFALFTKIFDKLIVEEFLSPNSIQNNQGFYSNRIKKSLYLSKLAKSKNNNNNSNINSENNMNSTDAISNGINSEQNLGSSGENQQNVSENNLQDSIPENNNNDQVADSMEILINLNILQEIEQSYILEDSLQELVKRIYFEREKQTIPIVTNTGNNNPNTEDAGSAGAAGGDLSGLMSLLGGGDIGGAQSGGLMTLLSKI